MNNISLFQFNGEHDVRVIKDEDGEPWFIAMEIAAILDYSDASKMTSRLDEDEKSNRQIGGLGPQSGGRGVIVINESGLYSAILGSNKPEAKPFKRWITREVLPSIRKTGGYQIQFGTRQLSKIDVEIAGAEAFARMLKPAPSSQIAMIAHIVKGNGGDPAFLPSYAIDAAPDSLTGSSMTTKPLTELLDAHGIKMSTNAYNRLLQDTGMLELQSRRTTSKRYPTGIKHYWAITDVGLSFGKNVTSTSSPRETQPLWYVDRFSELHARVVNRLEARDAN